MNIREYFDCYIENPLKTWWKARKYFRKSKMEFRFFTNVYMNCPYCSYNCIPKILDIRSFDVQWKDKYNTPRHEGDPYIWVCFFRKFGFSINFRIWFNDPNRGKRNGGVYYWEYLLDYLYYRKDINKVLEWEDVENKTIVPTKEFSLKKKWL